MSYLSKHRPICTVIQDIRELATKRGDTETVALCDEARGYAESMSRKLMEYKKREEAPVGYRHTITEPDGQTHKIFTTTKDNPWSHWLEKHLGECTYSVVALAPVEVE